MELKQRILAFMRTHRLAVIATNARDGPPESAVVGVAVSNDLDLVFDTTAATRKAANLRRDGRLSAVIGWDNEETVQFEGVADEPEGAERERVREIYFAAYPDGRDRLAWEGITHFRVRPTWIRFTSYLKPETSGEMRFED